LAQMSANMNQIMKTLTVVTAIFIPLTFIAGIYGMNFNYFPEIKWKYGYLFFLDAGNCCCNTYGGLHEKKEVVLV